ncbi:MAG: glycosyltransferase family 2 protein [Solobacterium sp.]|nr:glycosyltransferase family 2 protein [Solobacterium sp.]
MAKSKLLAKLELVKKALYIWAVQYHFVIPKDILKMYIRKFTHESENISKYANRYFDPASKEEYNQWLSYQEYPKTDFDDIAFLSEQDILNLSSVETGYVCLYGKDVTFYDTFKGCLSFCKDYDVLYFDHDHQDADGNRCDPEIKPDFSYNTLRGFNYIGNCVVVKTELMKQFEGQKWNIYRWLLELSDQKVRFGNVQKVVYCDRGAETSQAETLESYLQEHQIDAQVYRNPDGISHTVRYSVEGNPKVSLIIPTRDGKDVLKVCIDSIYEKTTWPNFEIIIADNGSIKEETLTYFREMEKAHDNIKVVRLDCPFNFSYINNRAVEQSSGDYIVLLNNDTSVVTEDWLERMLGYAQRENVGSVGVKLWYPDGSIQHGGVIVGKGGAAAHRYYRCEHNEKGYLHTLDVPNDVMCCTAACLMTSRRCWNEMNGLNEDLTVQFNDVDYGIRLYEAGYFNVFLPDVELIHYESKSRGIDKKKEAVERFFQEVNWAKETYGKYIEHDPFYSDNFDKNYDYKLKAGTGSN